MAYTHSKVEVEMHRVGATALTAERVDGVDLGTTGLNARWTCGFVPHLIKGAAVIPYVTTLLTNPAKFGFEADISVAGTPTRLFTITQPTAGTVHKAIYYRPTYDIEIKPGHVVDFRVTAAGSGNGKVILYVQARWEEPGNVTSILSTT